MCGLTLEERNAILYALEYFIEDEKRDIHHLSLPSGNPAFLPDAQKRLRVFESAHSKIVPIDPGSD